MTNQKESEETLDPQDWEATQSIGHRMLGDALDDLASIRSRPVWKQMPDSAKASLDIPAPHAPQSLDSVYEEFRKNIEPYAIGNRHPRFWGWVIGAGTPVGMLGDLLASAMRARLRATL